MGGTGRLVGWTFLGENPTVEGNKERRGLKRTLDKRWPSQMDYQSMQAMQSTRAERSIWRWSKCPSPDASVSAWCKGARGGGEAKKASAFGLKLFRSYRACRQMEQLEKGWDGWMRRG